ncbi:MAG: 8-oxo-dGTP diphosphatase [Acidimicrobiia bacterium]|jgi:8-oxo-dGTP diphosphatase|nr:8-oxo-dGTP diphosphatase [Acidimicrobiia bacterium]
MSGLGKAGRGGEVRAAGGVLWRRSPAGQTEVLVVHRPRDDWSFPKGKCERDEDDLACALREVEEETGYVARPGRELGFSRYVDGRGRPKVVRWWAMTVERGEPTVNDEVDELRWLPVDEAARTLSYDTDRHVLRQAVSLLDALGDAGS